MSKLSKALKNNPALASLLQQMLLAIVFGATPEQRQGFLDAHAAIDSDGDGVPDSEDEAPQDATVKTRKRKAS